LKKTVTLGLPLAVVATGALYVSHYLFNMAFKRVNYVPETSKEKQKYAQQYYDYVDWFKNVPQETWYLHENDPHKRLVATFIQHPDHLKKTVVISHGYKGNRETMANYAKNVLRLGL
jgi:hypothetical protein